MEIREIVEFYFNDTTNILEITFRTNDDSDDFVRYDEISLDETLNFGFDFIKEDRTIFLDEEYDEQIYEDEEVDFDLSELLSFLNEYYVVYPDKLPESESY